ncbi:flagellar assembly protein FliW [Fodinisporobacter ferrooxydans]|uniref:Flagellar assembly factor FliW n=1 Tax=Fodinisporobacter ferrooxydans TaxID=2901836 RepID=A0ABY4CLN2_9BACL|nr:flagellar assembly protein FliW [Alicyclobacillaceae bacterium MYW30-H2]
MEVQTSKFGLLAIEETQIVFFAKGVPGFPQAKRYVMIDLEEYRPFLFMQSIDEPDLMFLLVNPYQYFTGFPDVETIAGEAGWSMEEKERLLVRVIATISEKEGITVNLLAPILIHTKFHIGEQVILQKLKGLMTRHPIAFQSMEELEVGS